MSVHPGFGPAINAGSSALAGTLMAGGYAASETATGFSPLDVMPSPWMGALYGGFIFNPRNYDIPMLLYYSYSGCGKKVRCECMATVRLL